MAFIKKHLRLIVTFLLLILIFKMGLIKTEQLQQALSHPQIIFIGLIIFISQLFIFAVRWKYIVSLETEYSYWQSLKQCLIGNFFNFFIPSGVGGDVMKALSLAETQKISKSQAFSLTTIDRVLGLFCLILFSFLFLLIEAFIEINFKYHQLLKISVVFFFLACTGIAFLYFSKKIIPVIKNKWQFANTVKLIHHLFNFAEHVNLNIAKALKFKFLTGFTLISFLAQLLSIGFIFVVVQIIAPESLLSHQVSFILFFPLACFSFMASAIPLTPGGIGVGQAAFYFIFSQINTELATAVTVGISLMQLFTLLTSLPGGYFFSTTKKKTIIPQA